MMYRFYMDMDDTLVAFTKAVNKTAPFRLEQVRDKSVPRETFIKWVNDQGVAFWRNMEWLEGGKWLWSQVANLDAVLCTCPNVDWFEHSIVGKQLWVYDHIPNFDPDRLIFTTDKSQFAAPNHILVDDYDPHIEAWEGAGGVAIKHYDCSLTWQKLQQYVKN